MRRIIQPRRVQGASRGCRATYARQATPTITCSFQTRGGERWPARELLPRSPSRALRRCLAEHGYTVPPAAVSPATSSCSKVPNPSRTHLDPLHRHRRRGYLQRAPGSSSPCLVRDATSPGSVVTYLHIAAVKERTALPFLTPLCLGYGVKFEVCVVPIVTVSGGISLPSGSSRIPERALRSN